MYDPAGNEMFNCFDFTYDSRNKVDFVNFTAKSTGTWSCRV